MTPNDVQIVADNIDDYIEVPDGITRLRKAVISLAVTGKLVSQNIVEGAANELIKKETEDTKNEELFDIPKTWKWVQLSEIAEIYNGNSINKQTKISEYSNIVDGRPYIATKDIDRETHFVDYSNGIKIPYSEKKFKIAPKNSVLICSEGGNAGRKIAILDQDVCFGNKLLTTITDKNINSEFIFYTYTSEYFQAQFQSKINGIIGGISISNFKDLRIALPPSKEQERIVTKLREAMKQLDELETKKHERDEVRARFACSAMQSLGRGESKIAFGHLVELIKTPADLKELEGALLTLAVSGKLVAQDRKDGAIKREKATTEYGEEFNIPKSWAWFQLNDVCTFKYGYTDSAMETGTARFVRITDMGSDGNLIPDDRRYVDLSPESEKYLLSEGDLLTARIGATFGRTIIFREKYKAVFASYLIRMSFAQDFILPEYYWVFSKSGLYWNQAYSLVSGSAQPQFNANLIKKIYLPVPPLAEQKRIVQKVDEVMVLVSKLKPLLAVKK